jgi:hypothetical protein
MEDGGITHAVAAFDGVVERHDEHPSKIVARGRTDIQTTQPIVHLEGLDGRDIHVGESVRKLPEATAKIAQISLARSVTLLRGQYFVA